MSQKTATLLYGLKETGGSGYPCHWGGGITTLLDPEQIHVCAIHQREHAEIGFSAMQEKYPLAGKDERNSEFFRTQTERYLARAKSLTPEELKLIIERGFPYEQEFAQAILDGKTLEENDMCWLGNKAERFIDKWPNIFD